MNKKGENLYNEAKKSRLKVAYEKKKMRLSTMKSCPAHTYQEEKKQQVLEIDDAKRGARFMCLY